MQTTTRNREPGASFAERRGHVPNLSISDDNHHVTEAIGYMYNDEDDYDRRHDTRPSNNYMSSTVSSRAASASPSVHAATTLNGATSPRRKRVAGSNMPSEDRYHTTNGLGRPTMDRGNSWEGSDTQGSPPTSFGLRAGSPSETATTQFPLNDIDYESSPAAVAQELSNLQALRRMSMDVAAAGDPDLPSLNAAGMPGAPSSSASEDDSSRLFWVPARLHPELAPKEFKSFLDSKAEQIRRRSGELSGFSNSASSSRSASLSSDDGGGGLRRKKSMLSRQIDTSVGYQDGADRLERKRSMKQRNGFQDPNLQELESLVADTSQLQRMSLESQGDTDNSDIILPSVPGNSLKRSTRTTYRRGGSMKGRTVGDRTTYAERVKRRGTGAGSPNVDSVPTPSTPDAPFIPSFPTTNTPKLASTLPDSSATPKQSAPNFSRPAGHGPSPPRSSIGGSSSTRSDSMYAGDGTGNRSSSSSLTDGVDRSALYASEIRPLLNAPQARPQVIPIPQIVEVPPPEEPPSQQWASAGLQAESPPSPPVSQQPISLPERIDSRGEPRISTPARPAMPPKQSPHDPPVGHKRPPVRENAMPPQINPRQSLDQISANPSPLPGNDLSTDNLSFIPTLTEDKRADNKKVKEKKEESKAKSAWGWLLGKEEAEKDKQGDASGSKAKSKAQKPVEKHDGTRLDVLQASIDGGGKGRESLVLDRDNLKLEEERKRESQRKSAGSTESKKEKEGIFSSFFSSGKKNKVDKETAKRRPHSRGLSPEPPYRELKPDIDYNWTRFSILEERAIYRMAHIKLANPRRALYSQVLLSNFMYSYLAKVQQMHPQMNLPTSAKQQKKQQQKEQPDEFTQYQRYQQQQQQQRAAQTQQQLPAGQGYNQPLDYEGDTSMYDYSGNDTRPTARPSSRGSKHDMENGNAYGSSYGSQPAYSNRPVAGGTHLPVDDDDDDDMW